MEPWLIRISDYLFAQSWQIAVLTIVVAIATFGLRNRSAHVRYLLWLVVLAKALVPPLYSIPVAVLPQQKPAAYIPAPPIAERMGAEYRVPEATVTESSRPAAVPSEATSSPAVLMKPARYNTRAWLALGWLAGVVVLSFYYLLNALRTQIWLQRRRMALPSESASNIERFFAAHGVRRKPRIWLLERISQPFVWGLVRGSIYLPARLLDGKHAKFQPSLLGHELSHVIRLDAMVNSLQVIAQTVFWFHPFVWWANAKIRAEREKCCDEMTIARLNTPPEEYGEAILEILAAKYEQARPVPSLAVTGQVKNIEERIKTMLRPGKKFYKRPTSAVAIVALVIALLIVPTTLVLTVQGGTKADARALHQAAAAGEIEQVKSLLAEGTDVNSRDESGRTPLHLASLNNHASVAQALIAKDAYLDVKDKNGRTPLALAALEGRTATAELLIAKGANVNAEDVDGNTPIHLASIPVEYQSRRQAIIRRLIANGGNVNARNAKGQAAAHVAAGGWRGGHADTVLLLNELGTDVNAKDKSGNTLLHVAAKQARVRVTEDLLAKGANVNETNAKGQTPLHIAASHEANWRDFNIDPRRNVVQVLVAQGANVNAADQSQSTALHEAARAGHMDILEILVANGANVNAKDAHGHAPAYLALRATYARLSELLIDKGADTSSIYFAAYLGELPKVMNMVAAGQSVNTEDETGFAPLHAAAAGGHKDVVEYLITKGANATREARPGWTALSYATAGNHMEIVELLRSKGVGAGKGTSELLFIVARRGYIDAARILINLGAQINVGERTALHEATEAGHKEMVALLISKGAHVNVGSWTPLHVATQPNTGYIDIAGLLIDAGADIEAGDWTPLMEAAYYHKDMVSFLISKGANVNAKTSNGWTVLDSAEDDEGRPDIADLLRKHGAKE